MFEGFPGVSTPADDSVCLRLWLLIIIALSAFTVTSLLIMFTILSIRESVLMRRSRADAERHEDDKDALIRRIQAEGLSTTKEE
ncbi:hypothetical protein IAU59_006808 [Kwoniella sp. CBS 9459]